MNITLPHLLLVTGTAVIAGAVNSIAGGGTLLSFPTLLFVGVPALAANATNTVALFPGSFSAYWKYRDSSGKTEHLWIWLGIPSLVGGLLGALIAVRIGDRAFEHLVPWLVLTATVLFVGQEPIRRKFIKDKGSDLTETHSVRTLAAVAVFQLFVALYGGFFGAGIGILMLASLGFLGITDINKLNGLKNLSAFFINGAAALLFALKHQVLWSVALCMMIGAIGGGYLGASVAQSLPQKVVKTTIIVIGVSIALVMFIKELHGG